MQQASDFPVADEMGNEEVAAAQELQDTMTATEEAVAARWRRAAPSAATATATAGPPQLDVATLQGALKTLENSRCRARR